MSHTLKKNLNETGLCSERKALNLKSYLRYFKEKNHEIGNLNSNMVFLISRKKGILRP